MFVKLNPDLWVDACEVESVRVEGTKDGACNVEVVMNRGGPIVLIPDPPTEKQARHLLQEIGQTIAEGRSYARS